MFALDNFSNKNIWYKSYGLWSAVNPELRSLCSGCNGTIRCCCGCKSVLTEWLLLRVCVCVSCRKRTYFIESVSEIFQVISGNLRDMMLHRASWFAHLRDEHMLTPCCKDLRLKVRLTVREHECRSGVATSDVSVSIRRGCHRNVTLLLLY